ncbi:MAG: adenosine deaminase [Treponema sp.]|nr:adenosine deaminase [Treponema sp.]
MDKRDFYSLLKAVPKAEIHLHQEAVPERKIINKLYKKCSGREMTEAELNNLFSYNDLEGFLQSFMSVQRMFTEEKDLRFVIDALDSYVHANNIVYAETFFAPSSLLKKGFDFTYSINILTKGFKKIKEKRGCTIKTIVDVSRSFGLENAQHNLDLVLHEKNPEIIGIGLGGSETFGPARDFASVFDNAKKAGLHTVVHAGETEDSWSMKDAINLLHAERIGHGTSAAYDEEFIKELAATQLPLEVCPTSNLFTKKYVKELKDHPVKQLFDKGVFITINTDDPSFFKVSLIDEYWNIYSVLGFTLENIKKIIKNGFRASFISQEEKDAYCTKVDEAWDAWFESHPKASRE